MEDHKLRLPLRTEAEARVDRINRIKRTRKPYTLFLDKADGSGYARDYLNKEEAIDAAKLYWTSGFYIRAWVRYYGGEIPENIWVEPAGVVDG